MASNQANLKNARKQLDAEMAMQHATQSALDASVASGQRGAPWQPGAIVEGAQGSANPPPHRGSLHCRRRRRRGIHGLDWGEPEGEVLKPTALGDPEQREGTVRSPGIAPDGFGPWGVYHGTNYGGQGSLAPGGYVAVRESGFDQQPPLLSSLEGGGQDPELLGQASAHLCGGCPNRRGGCPLGMRQGDEFLSSPARKLPPDGELWRPDGGRGFGPGDDVRGRSVRARAL
jgi:hypothetical protein